MNMVLPKVHYYWQITDGRRDRTSRLQLLDLTTSTRDSHVGNNSYRSLSHVATVPPEAALPFPRRRTSTVSVKQDRTQERRHHQPGREL